ncbi:MAG: preprotein translocase subunit SecG [Chthoniobacterales bacterium]
MQILLYFLLTLHILVCVLMVLVVLMQRPRSEGLGAAFGSGMTENIFGAQTTHVLAKFTTWLGGAFFALTLALAVLYSHMNARESAITRSLMDRPEPKPAPAATTPAAQPAATPATAPGASAPTVPAAPAATTPVDVQPVAPLAPATPAAAPAKPATPATP